MMFFCRDGVTPAMGRKLSVRAIAPTPAATCKVAAEATTMLLPLEEPTQARARTILLSTTPHPTGVPASNNALAYRPCSRRQLITDRGHHDHRLDHSCRLRCRASGKDADAGARCKRLYHYRGNRYRGLIACNVWGTGARF